VRAVGKLLPLAIVVGACASGDGRGDASFSGSGLTTIGSGGETGGGDDTQGDSTAAGDTEPDGDDASGDDASGPAPGFDVGAGDEAGDETGECTADDMCCLMDGEIPPHIVLEAFLAAYPPANMPKTQDELAAFDPMAGGYTIAWHDANSGGEFCDPREGGIVQPNVEEGRAASRTAAEMVMAAGALVLDVREDPWLSDNPGGNPMCVASDGTLGTAGIGWAWGSILFQTPDEAIHEIVYLYIGYCVDDQDSEAFYYSNAPIELCAPPG
jgi:hypothetical protein